MHSAFLIAKVYCVKIHSSFSVAKVLCKKIFQRFSLYKANCIQLFPTNRLKKCFACKYNPLFRSKKGFARKWLAVFKCKQTFARNILAKSDQKRRVFFRHGRNRDREGRLPRIFSAISVVNGGCREFYWRDSIKKGVIVFGGWGWSMAKARFFRSDSVWAMWKGIF